MPQHSLTHWLTLGLLISLTAALGQVRVLAPNGGEIWPIGSAQEIRWTSEIGDGVYIQLYRGSDFDRLITGSTPNDGSHLWSIPDFLATGANYRVRIVSTASDTLVDWSDQPFSLTLPSVITLTDPNGGESWLVGSTHPITWTDNFAGNLGLDLFRAGTLERSIAPSVPNTGNFAWTIPEDLPEASDYRVRIRSLADTAVWDWSDTTFALMQPPGVRLLTPNGGEGYFMGDTCFIRWTSMHLDTENVRIDFKRNYPGSSWVTLAAATPNDGEYAWQVTGPVTHSARIRVRGTFHSTASDTSDGDFSIVDGLVPPTVVIYQEGTVWRLAWPPVAGARHYRVWQAWSVGGGFDLLTTTADTSCAIDTGAARQFYCVTAERP